MKWTLERGRLILHVGCVKNLVIIAALVKIEIELIDTMCLSCYCDTLLMILSICFLLFHYLIDFIVIYILVFVDLLIVIDCYIKQIWHQEGLMMQIL